MPKKVRKKRVKKPLRKTVQKRRLQKHTGQHAQQTTQTIKNVIAELEQKKTKTQLFPTPPILKKKRTHLKKRDLSRNILIISGFIVLFFIAILMQRYQITQLQEEIYNLHLEIYDMEQQNFFYKKAYEATLDDIKQISSSFGGEERYNTLAAELRERELAILIPEVVIPHVTLEDTNTYTEYVEKGIIRTECLAVPVVVDTIQEEVLVTLETTGDAPYTIYIDGNLLTREHQFTTSLPRGEHALDIIIKEGTLALEALTFDDVTVPLDTLTRDAGEGWAVFDCEKTKRTTKLKDPGALRMLITKR